MRNNISYNIVKKVRVENSPFKIAIYIYKNQNKILVENLETGRCVEADSHTVNSYLKIQDIETAWKRSFDHSYVRYSKNNPEYFMPLYQETNRFATLRFKIVSRCAPQFRTIRVPHPTDSNRTVQQVDNTEVESTVSPLKPYNVLFKNIKDFETENFKLEMEDDDYYNICDENFEKLKTPYIECRVPLFQIYATLSPKIDLNHYYSNGHFNYEQSLTVTKINDKFYRFPYGNTKDTDNVCLGSQNLGQYKQPDSIQEVAYLYMVATHYNGDYTPHLKFNNDIPTTLDIDWIREKVNKNEFEFSFVDALFYLSQCETVEEVNLNMFILTPNIPEEIMDFEKKLFNLYNPAKAEEETVKLEPDGFPAEINDENVDEDYTDAFGILHRAPIRHRAPVAYPQTHIYSATTRTTTGNHINYTNFTTDTEHRGQILVDDPPIDEVIEENFTVNVHDREILGQIATSLEERQATETYRHMSEHIDESVRQAHSLTINDRDAAQNMSQILNELRTGGTNDTDREGTGQN